MNEIKKTSLLVVILFYLISFFSCNSLKTAVYDQYSYQQDISLKIETKNLLRHGTEEFSLYEDKIEGLLMEMEKMEEYEKNKPDNIISYKMWQLMTDVDKNSVAGLFKKWKENQQLSPAFLKEATQQISEAFDALIKYEISKNEEKENVLLQILKDY